MKLEAALDMARRERLYPAVILYGQTLEARQQAALRCTRILLCEFAGTEQAGCEAEPRCRHCRRISWPAPDAPRFHPDLHVLERDLRTSTSVDATKAFLREAYNSPFEAPGQVFVIAEADTLSTGAADSLLKLLEEPPTRSPRHFLLLAASRLDLQATLRSRSLAIFLGSPEELEPKKVEELQKTIAPALDSILAGGAPIDLLSLADLLGRVDGFEDPRARRPWSIAAAALLAYLEKRPLTSASRRKVLDLADTLLDAPRWRVRGITATRLLEGLVARHLV